MDAICEKYGWLPSNWLKRDPFDCMVDVTVALRAKAFHEARGRAAEDPETRRVTKPRPKTVTEIRRDRALQAAAFDEMKAKLERAGRGN